MTVPQQIPDLSWFDVDVSEVRFTNNIGPAPREGVIAFVTMPSYQEDGTVEMTADEALCLRRWLNDALTAAGCT